MKNLNIMNKRLFISVLIVILLFFTLIAIGTSHVVTDRLRSNSLEHYQLLADNTAGMINSWLSEKKEIVENQRAALMMVDDFSTEYLTDFLSCVISERSDLDEICDLYFVDVDGKLSTAKGFYTDFDLRSRGWYKNCIDTREVQYTSPYRDISTGSFITTISVGCQRKDNSFAGVLALDIYIDAFLDAINNVQVPENSYLFLIDNNNALASHPYEDYGYVDEFPRNISDLPGDPYKEIGEMLKAGGQEMIGIRDYDGVLRDMFISRINSCNWFVVAAISDTVIKTPERIMVTFIITALFISLSVGIIWTFFGMNGMMKRLNEAMEAANSANESKSAFLADMSHEVRTPINAVLGMAEMIRRESADSGEKTDKDPKAFKKSFENIYTYAGSIKSAGNNLLAIINDIRDFSGIENGVMEINCVEYKLSCVLNDVQNMISFKTREKGLDFFMDIEENLPNILYGDDVRVRQVIMNLLDNAVKYTNRGSVTLSIRAEGGEIPGPGQQIGLVIAISDTGIGIKKEDIVDIFTKFERFGTREKGNIVGMGLGLAIARKLLLLMDGEIHVESVFGEGTTFTILLPQKVVSGETIGDYQSRAGKNCIEDEGHRDLFTAPDACILAVDDTYMNLVVLKELLKDTKIKIDTAAGGKEAVRLAEEKKYDIILMDQRMPKMDGIQTMKTICSSGSGLNKDTPFICLTADAISGAKDRYIAEGFADYLTKPVDVIVLENMLLRYLPQNKVIFGGPEPEKNVEAAEGSFEMNDVLEAGGINTESGLMYCENDRELYKGVLEVYLNGARERTGEIGTSYDNENWEDYAVYVHALKSTSKMIGALKLSGTAADMEAAADERNIEFIKRDHEDMMAQYECVVNAIRSALGKEESGVEGIDGVMEFYPEEEVNPE